MVLCGRKTRETVYPKKLGESSPNGVKMSLFDLGPDTADERYVLNIVEEQIMFHTEAEAYQGWNEVFRSHLTRQPETVEDNEYEPA